MKHNTGGPGGLERTGGVGESPPLGGEGGRVYREAGRGSWGPGQKVHWKGDEVSRK